MSVYPGTSFGHIETFDKDIRQYSGHSSATSHKMQRSSIHSGHGDNLDTCSNYSDSFDDSDNGGEKHLNDYRNQNKSLKKSYVLKRPNNGYGSRPKGPSSNNRNRSSGNSKISPRQFDEVTRNIMQTSEVKIKDLKNQNEDLKRQINDLLKELKTQQRQNKLQGKQLDKVTNQEAEVPSLVARHSSEIQTLQEQLRRQKDKNEVLTRQNKELDYDLSRLKKQCTRLKDLTENKQLGERDTLAKQVSLLESRLELEEKNRADLERNMELINKNHRHELSIEIHRSKDLRQKLKERDERIRSLEMNLKEKTKQLEMQHIYSQRVLRGPYRMMGNQNTATGDEQALVPVSAESNHSINHHPNQKNKKKDKQERSKSLDRPTDSTEKKTIKTPAKQVTPEKAKVSVPLVDSKRVANEKLSTKETNLNYSMELPEIRDSDDSMWSQLEEMARNKDQEKISEDEAKDRAIQERLHKEEMDRLNKEKEEANQRLKELESITANQRKLEDEERKRKDKLLDTLRKLDFNSDPSASLRPNSKTKSKPIDNNKHQESSDKFPWSFSTYEPSTPDLPPKSKSLLPNALTKPPAVASVHKEISFSDTDDEMERKRSANSRSSSVAQGHPGLMASSKHRTSFGSGDFKSSMLMSANNSAMNAPTMDDEGDYEGDDDDDDIEIEELHS